MFLGLVSEFREMESHKWRKLLVRMLIKINAVQAAL
jgi:hypothetical protein